MTSNSPDYKVIKELKFKRCRVTIVCVSSLFQKLSQSSLSFTNFFLVSGKRVSCTATPTVSFVSDIATFISEMRLLAYLNRESIGLVDLLLFEI
jgi:hypothetical protein